MLKFFKSLIISIFVLFSLSSCWRNPTPTEGFGRHNSKIFRYLIDYPNDVCNVSADDSTNQQVLQIGDKNSNYLIHILALKADNDKRYKFGYYTSIDSLYYKDHGTLLSETKDFFSDRITRTYSINQFITMETTSIYGGQYIYVIYSKFNELGKQDAAKITSTFKTTSGIGPINFCKRKIYSIIGDNGFSVFLCYLIFSILLTLGFWGGIVLCCQADNVWVGFSLIVPFTIIFGCVVLTEEFLGYLYGHNSLFQLIMEYIAMFVDEG